MQSHELGVDNSIRNKHQIKEIFIQSKRCEVGIYSSLQTTD
jgi:hypothetical protein